MPELANSALELLSIEIPAWLRQAISPWQVEEAKVGSKGVELVLRSERARVPLRLALTSDGSLRTSLLDARISRAKAAALVRALELRLQARPLHEWLTKLQTLAERLDRGSLRDDDPSLACWYDAWRVWPGHEHSPREQIDELPTAIWAHTSELPRTILAALALHRIGRGELLEALTIWDSLPPASAEPGLTELHLDAVALGLLGRRSEALARLARAEANAVQPEEWLTIARVYETLDDREAAVAAHERVIALRGHGWDRLRLAMARGALVPGEARPRPDPAGLLYERVSFARQLVKILDATGRYDDQLEVIAEFADAAPPDLVLRAARLHLWRGELAQARARVESLPAKPRDPKAQMILAATAVLEGRPFLALELLEQIPGREPLERLLWQAEAHLALGQIEDAIECLDRHIVLENSLAAYLLKLIALVRWDPDKALNSSIDQRTFLDA
ncbi:MAG TPA: hypothetical protein VK034_23475, partial [Enhygromyxa sp.]|nr:hypothetical protein [Enhygromyxa sp.]